MTRRGRVGWIVAASAVAVAAVVVALRLANPSEKAFYAYLDERRAAHLPTTREDLAGAMPPDEENGAPALVAAWKRLPELCPESEWTCGVADASYEPPEHGGWPDGADAEQKARLAHFVERVRPWSAARDAALAKPRMHFGVHVHVAFDLFMENENVRPLQGIQRLISNQAIGEDDPARRLAAIRALVRLGNGVEPQSSDEARLGEVIAAAGTTFLRRDVESGRIDPATARAACDDVLRGARIDDARALLRAWPVEVIEEYRAMLEGRVQSPPSRGFWGELDVTIARTRDRLAGRTVEFEFGPGRATEVVAISRAMTDASTEDPRKLTAPSAVNVFDPSGTLHAYGPDEAVARIASNAVRYEAQQRLARVALAVAERKSRTGAFPASLDELRGMFADGMPLDPYTDAAFTYEPTADGVRIASKGAFADHESSDSQTPLADRGLEWRLRR